MEEQNDSSLELIAKAVKKTIEGEAIEIQQLTIYLDKKFKGLNASKLPEYKRAIDAMREYGQAWHDHIIQKNKE